MHRSYSLVRGASCALHGNELRKKSNKAKIILVTLPPTYENPTVLTDLYLQKMNLEFSIAGQ
jgi:hypothetical protein